MSKNADGRRDRKEGQGICQCTDLSQGSNSGCTKDPNREAGIGRRFGENWMHRLLNKLWNVKDEGLVRELVKGAPNEFDHTVQCRPEKWTALVWRETYGFKPEGYGWALRTDKYIVG